MNSKFISRKEITLNESQIKMVISGWGEEAYKNSAVEKITYLSDGLKVNGYLAYPKDYQNKKFPCIIWNRGGFKEKGAIDKFTARGIFGQLAGWGYIVFASQYRGNAGSEGEESFGGNDVNDILNLMPIAEEIPPADTGKWGIEGWSRGGMMTLLTLLKNSNFFDKGWYTSSIKCAVLSGAISNFKSYLDNNAERKSSYKNLFGKDFEEEINKRTIIDKVDMLPKIPYLLMHGGKDDTVLPNQTLELSIKFFEANILHRLVIFEEGDHFLKNYRKEVDEQRRIWFDKYLKK
jgi:dipeptidyl aminopeptidase/acylaminoacyl peptidase